MAGMVAPTLDIDAVEKKISDLKSVEKLAQSQSQHAAPVDPGAGDAENT